MNTRNDSLPLTIFLGALGVSISRDAFIALERVFRCYRAELGAQSIDSDRIAVELYNAGLVTAPKGKGGAVIPTERALDAFELVNVGEDVVELREPRNAFEGVFVPVRAVWQTTAASDAFLPLELA